MSRLTRTLSLALLVAAGFVAGVVWERTPPVQAEIVKSPPREAFQSGGARSEVVLKEISETMKRIETRVQNIEEAVTVKKK